MGNELKELYSNKDVNVHNADLERVDQSILLSSLHLFLNFK